MHCLVTVNYWPGMHTTAVSLVHVHVRMQGKDWEDWEDWEMGTTKKVVPLFNSSFLNLNLNYYIYIYFF